MNSGAGGEAMSERVFVTGTDTGIGKTVVSAALTLGLDGHYWKPIQSGAIPPTDTEQVRAWTGLPESRFLPEAYSLHEPMSPHASASLEGVQIELDHILNSPLPTDASVVIEGAGGLMVPLNPDSFMVDLIQRLAAPVVLVARTGLGTLNHTLLSLSELDRRSVPVLGVILNGEAHESNRQAIEKYGNVPVLGRVPTLNVIDKTTLLNIYSGFIL